MDKNEALEWLAEHDCYVGEYDGDGFVVVEPQSDNPVDDPLFIEALYALGIEKEEDIDYHYGYGDEYTTCSNCGTIIRTSPTHACWMPDYWVDLDVGEIFCNKCTKENADEYFKWLAEETADGGTISCVLDPEEHGFTRVIEDLEYGYHPGQNDDPRKLVIWANENSFELAFTVLSNPYTKTFDVWLRGKDTYAEDTDECVRATIDVKQIRKMLLVSDSRYSHLRTQFREWPSPAEQMKAKLRRNSKGG